MRTVSARLSAAVRRGFASRSGYEVTGGIVFLSHLPQPALCTYRVNVGSVQGEPLCLSALRQTVWLLAFVAKPAVQAAFQARAVDKDRYDFDLPGERSAVDVGEAGAWFGGYADLVEIGSAQAQQVEF